MKIIKAGVGKALPFFQCRFVSADTSRQLATYEGQHYIESVDLATKDEVLEFLKARETSKEEKPIDHWLQLLNVDWHKVLLRKCPEHEQTGNPMEQ